MRRGSTGIVALLLLAACASAARADPFESAEPDVLRQCVAEAGASAGALYACIGVVARPCIPRDGGATSSWVLCWSAEADVWREFIDTFLRQLQQREPERSAEDLAAAQAAWAAWMEAECSYWAWAEGGGSGQQVDGAMCMARLSAERAISLRLVLEPPR